MPIPRPFFRNKSTGNDTIKATLSHIHIRSSSSSTLNSTTPTSTGSAPSPRFFHFHSNSASHIPDHGNHHSNHEHPGLQPRSLVPTSYNGTDNKDSANSTAEGAHSSFLRPARPAQTSSSSAPAVITSSLPTTNHSTYLSTTESNTAPVSPQFTLLAHHEPASWTIALILEELGLTYSIIPVGVRGTSSESRSNPDTDGVNDFFGWASKNQLRMSVPALVDHSNEDWVLIETGAIVMYLVERYGGGLVGEGGNSREICPGDDRDKAIARQWLFFSATEHSRSFSQACHFLYDHPQKLPSATSYTTTLIHHALNTLNTNLSTSPTGYLVPTRDHPTYADLIFWSWNWVYESGGLPELIDGCGNGTSDHEQDCWKRYPHVGEWQGKMNKRESVQRVVEKWERLKLEYV